MTDRYLRIVLTIIALELGWIAARDHAPAAAAQAQPPAQRVVLTGIDFPPGHRPDVLPTAIAGTLRNGTLDTGDLRVRLDAATPLRIAAREPLPVRTTAPVTIDTTRPLRVENVGYVGSPRPGE